MLEVTWPNDVTVRTVTGTYLAASGLPAKGRITFTPTARVVDKDDAIIVEDTLVAILDANGSFSIVLPVTDNPLLIPKLWAYTVSVRIYGVRPRSFTAYLPYGDGSDVDIETGISAGAEDVGPQSGPSSTQGPIGPRGPGTIVGIGLPTFSIGQDGDIYIDSNTGYYYGPKTAGEWPGVPFFTAGATQRHVHTQAAASATWTITHVLGGKPSVTVVDSSGTVVFGEVRYDSNTVVTVLFTAPFSGYAYLT